MPQCGIYQIVNTITGDCYVGSAVNFHVRKLRHLNELRQGIHHSLHLQRAYDKYGKDVFVFTFLEDVIRDRDTLFQRESHWVQQLHPQYNTGKVNATALGAKRTEETRKRITEKATGRKHSEETRRKQSERKFGIKQSPEFIQKRSEGMLGHAVSEENRQKFAERSREMWANRTPEEKRAIVEKRSPEVQEKNRERMRELGKDPDRIAHIKQVHLGAKRSEETRQKQREAWVRRKQRQLENPKPPVENTQPPKEYKYSEETRRRMSEGKKASWDKKKAAQAETIQQQNLFD